MASIITTENIMENKNWNRKKQMREDREKEK